MDVILDWVKSGLLFGILGSVIIMLSPNKSYEKYISFVVGLLFILVMIHPLMEFFSLDSTTFLRSVENFLILENNTDGLSENDKKLYEDALGLQLKTVFTDAGCQLENVVVKMDNTGKVYQVNLIVTGRMIELSQIEGYIHNLFGEEVILCYENE